MKRIIRYFAEQSLLVNIISVALVISGLLFMFTAKKEAFPRVDFDWVIINTIYPGSTAEDVEKHITIPIETKMKEIDGIEEIHGTSLEALSTIAIQVDPDARDKDKTINDIKDALDKVNDLPDDAEDPEFTELNTAMTPVMEISLINKNGIRNDSDEFELRKYAKMLEDRLLEISGVGKVDKKGYREREMIVEVLPEKLQTLHVAINEVINALSKKNLNFPGGIIKTPKGEFLIRTIGEVKNTGDIEKVLIRANDTGYWVRVGNLAKVKDSFEEEDIINKTLGEKSITLTVVKKESADIIRTVNDVRKELARFKKMLPGQYEMSEFNDMSFYVKRRLDVLVNNGIVGFSLVVVVLFITLGWRIALVTALGIPFSMFFTFIWMGYVDLSINLMSMFGLILVLGMLVDDAIVVAENIYRHIEEGDTVKDAVLNGTMEVIAPVAGTVLTTIVAFAPLMFMKGVMGKFMWVLPAVVIASLIASWIESMFILPSHIYELEKNNKKHDRSVDEREGKIFRTIKNQYTEILKFVLRHRYISIILITVFFFGSLLFAGKFMKLVLFPQGGVEVLTIKAEAPTGTTVQKMSKKLEYIEKSVAELPSTELDTFTTKAGIIQENPTDPYTKRGSNYGIVMVYLTPFNKRERVANDILESLRKNSESFKNEFTKIEYGMVRTGPPVGKPVSVAIKGDDFEILKEISAIFKEHLVTVPGLKDVKDDYEDYKNELRVYVDEKTAAITGITVFDIATTIRSCFEGTVATTIKKTDEEIDIRVIFPEKMRENLNSIRDVKIANRLGNLIPITQVVSFDDSASGISVIKRKDWRRIISVTAEIDEKAKGVTSVSVNRALVEKFRDIEEKYPGYTVSYEGEFKDTSESMGSLLKSFIVAALGIYIILVWIFRSLSHPFIIMGVIPLTLTGIIWIFFFHGLPLSFMALMGVVGLAGVVVNNSIVLIDFIRVRRMQGMNPYEAAIDSAPKRLRPIFLTTITTFFGLIPTAYGIGGYDPFLVPMAISLSWGIAFGTIITLFATPILYVAFADLRLLLFRKYQEVLGPEGEPTILQLETEIEETVKTDILTEIHSELRNEIKEIAREEIKKEIGKRSKPVKKSR
ncbi:MAG TPA: efflux RND transporter permease subunit [Spirochaetota bacterium]|nr:efflux RND transporter permease subunit [Spirochaetota bacterium]